LRLEYSYVIVISLVVATSYDNQQADSSLCRFMLGWGGTLSVILRRARLWRAKNRQPRNATQTALWQLAKPATSSFWVGAGC